ncbi:MAG: FG-GAP-like repeat-containing protein [Propionicimonas sp.]|uniref:hypothetical protein n=1 Tax=Propionicimonas sp. TaxID=1955623 RepID=UPI003D112B6D
MTSGGVGMADRRGSAVVAVGAVMAVLSACTGPAAPGSPAVTSSPSPESTHRVTPAVVSAASPDFDGDGGADLVVGIGTSPGRVSVRYANGASLDLGRGDVDTAGADSVDFGQGLLARDLNGDGYTDLVVADPGDGSGLSLYWLYGGPKGLDPAACLVTTNNDSPGAGRALALVTAPSPVLVVGGGGTVLTYTLDADGRPAGDPGLLTPATLGLPDVPAASRFGWSVAAHGALLVVGAPGEKVDGAARAGAIYAIDFSAAPMRASRLTQNWPGVPDVAEAGDWFGGSLSLDASWLVVGVPGESREDERGHTRAQTGMVQVFSVAGTALEPGDAIDQRDIPGNVEADDRFGTTVALVTPCEETSGVLVGAANEAIGNRVQAGAVWVVPIGPTWNCGAIQLYDSGGLGAKARAGTLVGSAVSTLRVGEGGDTLVIAAQGDWEEGVPGRVLTLDRPYTDAPVVVLDGLAIKEERTIALSPSGR